MGKEMQCQVAEKLDEMADLSEHWKRNRDKGRTPTAIMAAIIILLDEVGSLLDHEKDKLTEQKDCFVGYEVTQEPEKINGGIYDD